MWPRRFGSGLLAAKVLRDTTYVDPEVLAAFQAEAHVLSETE
jgi:hypothetical protein